MHTLDHTAYLITEENFSALSNIIENEWKPLGYTFCEPFTSTAANYTLSEVKRISYDSIIGKYIHGTSKKQLYIDTQQYIDSFYYNKVDLSSKIKYDLKENAYLVTASNMAVLQKILETEWQPFGYYIASGCNTIQDANKRFNNIGKYMHASGKRLYFNDGDYVANSKHKNLIDNINALINID